MTVMESSMLLGDGKVFPPGFRFHPTDEELVLYYLKGKICRRRLNPGVIGVSDVYKWDPEDLPGQSTLKTGDRQWYFFSPRDRKYPNGARTNRATRHGYWKATGKDRIITYKSRSVGLKKTLVFYKGRAPTGKRSDWVMHEYTLDEDELRRCQPGPDYYALYKLYKKSGAGPRNGEQYGAPFREEDWADDGNVCGSIDREDALKQVNQVVTRDDTQVNDEQGALFHDLEEFMNQTAEEPIFVPPPAVHFDQSLQLLAADGDHSTLVNLVSGEGNISDRNLMFISCSQQDSVLANFDFTQSVISQLQPCEAFDVTSALPSSINAKEPCVVGEDFLEMDDLLGEQQGVLHVEEPIKNLQFDEIDGLNELDVYHDVAMFLHDLGPCESGQVCQPQAINSNNVVRDPVSDLYFNSPENGTTNFQLQSQSFNGDPVSCLLWTHGQQNIPASAEANGDSVCLQSPGLVCGDTFENLPSEVNQNCSSGDDDGSRTWFSSALWAFVESVPSSPASASESALVSRAFERVSSFSRLRLHPRNGDGAATNPSRTITMLRYGKSRKSFICISVVGVICAILWIFVR